jgi:putative ATPase
VAGERYLPSVIGQANLYQPSDRGLEKQLAEKLAWLRQLEQNNEWQRGEHD